MDFKCKACDGTEIIESKLYPGVMSCICGFLIAKIPERKLNIILPEDPMDALLCESCQ